MSELGLEEIIHQGITIIEWPEIAEEFLPEKTIKIYLSYYKDCRKAIIYAKKDIIENIKKMRFSIFSGFFSRLPKKCIMFS